MSICSCQSPSSLATLSFERVELRHRDQLNSLLAHTENPCCDLSFANLFVWGESYQTSFAISKGMLIIRCIKNGESIYMPPIGNGDFDAALRALVATCHREDQVTLRMLCITDRERRLLEQSYPERFTFSHMRDNDDYIHLTAKLGELQGKTYHGKRGHVKKFHSQYNALYHPMTTALIDSVLEMNREWTKLHQYTSDDADDEMRATHRLLTNFEALELVGGVLMENGKIIGASCGSRHHPGSDTIVVHFEKALLSYEGIYSALNNAFMADCMKDFTYANREEDMGLEGLRKSKLSYKPDILLEKYEGQMLLNREP